MAITYETAFFPEIDTTHIEKLRKRFFPYGTVLKPRIPLLAEKSSVPHERIVECIEGTVNRWQPFEIQLIGLDKTHPDGWLFLEVQDGNHQIVALQKALRKCIGGTTGYSTESFVPRITLGFFANDQSRRNAAYEEAITLSLRYHTLFDRVTTMAYDSRLHTVVESQDFKLGGAL